jgi:hypothetical protein
LPGISHVDEIKSKPIGEYCSGSMGFPCLAELGAFCAKASKSADSLSVRDIRGVKIELLADLIGRGFDSSQQVHNDTIPRAG